MALAGSPQWAAVASVIKSGAGTTEVDVTHDNGLTNTSGAFAEASVSKTVTAGPTTAGPVEVTYNGVHYVFPFNVAVTMPDAAWKCLDTSVWTYA